MGERDSQLTGDGRLCRGDVDDRVLMEAILPLLQALATSPDVRPVLHRRFDMRRWFISQVRLWLILHNAACRALFIAHLTVACLGDPHEHVLRHGTLLVTH